MFSAVLADIESPRRDLGDNPPISHAQLVAISHMYYSPPFGTVQSDLRHGVRAYVPSWCTCFYPLWGSFGVCEVPCGLRGWSKLAMSNPSVQWLLNASVMIWGWCLLKLGVTS